MIQLSGRENRGFAALHSDPEMKTGINSFFMVLEHFFSDPIQG
jgi:hypothetical protein